MRRARCDPPVSAPGGSRWTDGRWRARAGGRARPRRGRRRHRAASCGCRRTGRACRRRSGSSPGSPRGAGPVGHLGQQHGELLVGEGAAQLAVDRRPQSCNISVWMRPVDSRWRPRAAPVPRPVPGVGEQRHVTGSGLSEVVTKGPTTASRVASSSEKGAQNSSSRPRACRYCSSAAMSLRQPHSGLIGGRYASIPTSSANTRARLVGHRRRPPPGRRPGRRRRTRTPARAPGRRARRCRRRPRRER